MFRLLGRISQFLTGSLFGSTDSANASVPPVDESRRSRTCASAFRQSQTVVEPVSGETDVSKQLRINEHYGHVTAVFLDYGLIDDNIYFNLKLLPSGSRPQVGDRVVTTASRQPHSEGWRASAVRLVSERQWDDDDEATDSADEVAAERQRRHEASAVRHSQIGCVNQLVDRRYCYVTGNTENICLDLMECTHNFTPEVGDWISILTNTLPAVTDIAGETADHESSMDRSEVKCEINALRTREFEGTISSMKPPYGTIDDEIYFKMCDTYQEWKFSVGDQVRGTAIESKYECFEWRATDILLCATIDQQRYDHYRRQNAQSLVSLVQNKRDVDVPSQLNFGTLPRNQEKSLPLTISNNGTEVAVLKTCKLYEGSKSQLVCLPPVLQSPSTASILSLAKLHKHKANEVLIPPGGAAILTIVCCGKLLGKFQEVVTLNFDGFEIGCKVHFKIQDSDQHLLNTDNVRPFEQTQTTQFFNRTNRDFVDEIDEETCVEPWILPGRRLQIKSVRLPVILERYPVPKDLIKCHREKRDLDNWLPSIKNQLNFDNYKLKFDSLLHMEEIQATEDMSKFDMYRVCMQMRGEYLVLEVPGLAEGRPSVISNDSLVASDPDDPNGLQYQGIIHQVRGEELLLQFNQDYHSQFTGTEVNIRFQISRSGFRRCHQAVGLYWRVKDTILFPSVAKSTLKAPRTKFDMTTLINRSLNERQRSAVQAIMEGRRRPAPYIIYGPPGTGKTVTLVESVIQVFLRQTDSRVLVCAPSNSAADLVCERLLLTGKLTTADMIRMNSHHRSEEALPESIVEFCTPCTTFDHMLRYRIIVSTCMMSGILYNLGVQPGHFTHIFIDEAGQATEPETLVPVCLAAAQNADDCHIILAGDPKQLGPVLRSRAGIRLGLQRSFLERLSLLPAYRRDENQVGHYDAGFITKLTDNYRAHPCLVTLPSDIFYNSELRPRADPILVESLCGWNKLPNQSFPMLFHGIRGDDLQEADSPSWFNAEEAFQVLRYLQSLYCDVGLKASDIGIITPYRKQVEKIRLLLRSLKVEAPKIGSVEEFQGQERLAILLSTVRSSDELHDFDRKHNLGFLSNPKRFNVSITRAQALLVVVGNPFVLIKDPHWRKLIRHCVNNSAYVGVDATCLTDVMANLE